MPPPRIKTPPKPKTPPKTPSPPPIKKKKPAMYIGSGDIDKEIGFKDGVKKFANDKDNKQNKKNSD